MTSTPNQVRDSVLDTLKTSDVDEVHAVVQMARLSAEERKEDAETYLKCPRCYGLHSVHGNFDDLCDSCVNIILVHFPDHESVPFIREAMKQWEK